MTDARDWIGRTGNVWASEWARTDRSFDDLSRHLDAAIQARLGDGPARVVDVGCGAGTTSIATARHCPAAEVIGIDISPDLIAIARSRSAGHGNLRFDIGAVETLVSTYAPVDIYVSRHGVMFFDDPRAAFAALHAAAVPGGAMIFSCFRSVGENPWANLVSAADPSPPSPGERLPAPGPFAFADPDQVAALLTRAGWRDATATPVDYTYRAGAGIDPVADALDFFTRIGPAARALRDADPIERKRLVDRLCDALTAHRTGDSVDFPAAAWLWSATA